MDALLLTLDLVFQPYALGVMLLAALFGLFIGSIPHKEKIEMVAAIRLRLFQFSIAATVSNFSSCIDSATKSIDSATNCIDSET